MNFIMATYYDFINLDNVVRISIGINDHNKVFIKFFLINGAVSTIDNENWNTTEDVEKWFRKVIKKSDF